MSVEQPVFNNLFSFHIEAEVIPAAEVEKEDD